jgi:tripartite-type tricarboxylate transporter receptor subunit TctC
MQTCHVRESDMTDIDRRKLLQQGVRGAALVGLAAAGVVPVAAQSPWPQRPVTMIVSQSAGASPDVFARLLAEKLNATLRQPVVIDNKPGAGNAIGAVAAARAAPDGHTFFFGTSAALSMNPFLMKNLPYDSLNDFVPVALVTRSHQVLVAHPDVPASTLADVIALAKKDPDKYSIVIDGPRNLSGVIVRVLKARAGINLTEVPYSNVPASLQDVMTGRIAFGLYSVSVAEALIKDGKLKLIATASADGANTFPGAEPFNRTLPGFNFLGWFMVMAPKGTPEPILNAMHQAIAAAIRDPAVQTMAPKFGFDIDPKGIGSRDDARQFLAAQLELWSKTTKDLGILPE